MHKTLKLIGAMSMSISVLTAAQCSVMEPQGNMPGVDMAGTDLATGNPDLSTGDPDLSTPGDMTGMPGDGPTEFVVVRIGTGTSALTNDATAAFLERRRIEDGALVGAPLALPTAASGANKQLTLSGVATVEGQLSRSADGRYLIIAGYAANPGVRDISTSSSTAYNRVVGRIDAANNIDTSTATSAYSGAAVRGATSTDGTMMWISTDIGIGYTTFGSTEAPTVLSTVLPRAIDVFGTGNSRQLYVSSSSTSGGSYRGVNAVGSGTPTMAGTPVTRLPGFTDGNSPSPVGFWGFDRDGNGDIDQLYVADDSTTGGGVKRFRLSGSSWTFEGTISTGANAGARYLTGYLAGNNTMLLVTTAEEFMVRPRILLLTDGGGATSEVTSQVLATAALNTTYRGIALAPNP